MALPATPTNTILAQKFVKVGSSFLTKPFEKIDLFYAGRVRDRAPTRTLWLFWMLPLAKVTFQMVSFKQEK